MRLSLALATYAVLASSHVTFTTLFINDINQGDGTCVRMPIHLPDPTIPVDNLTSSDMACGYDGQNAVAFSCPAAAGANLTFEFRHTPDDSLAGTIDPSHKGPCSVYLKAVSPDMSMSAAGPGWFKIWDEGYDVKTGQFCTEKLIANKGLLSVSLPPDLPAGYYLVRPELLTLNDATANDPQFYVGCAQIFVQGTTDALEVPAERQVSIPGHVKKGEPSVTFNIWAVPLRLPYVMPGPAVYRPVNNSATLSTVVQTSGLSNNCLLKNANWCGVEVAAYKNEAGCWAASDACFDQQQACYDSAPASGEENCDLWGNTRCMQIQNACSAGKFVGPPDTGKKLTEIMQPLPGPIPPAQA